MTTLIIDHPAAVPGAPMPGPCMRLRLLGGFELTTDDGPVELADSAQHLVSFLALRRRPQTRLCVAGNLWPDRCDDRATANLRSTLWRARIHGCGIVVAKGSLLSLAAHVSCDVAALDPARLEAFAAAGDSTPLIDADSIFDELLPGWYEDWVIMERERLGQIQLRAAEALAVRLADQRDFIRATDLAYRTLALDPSGRVKDQIISRLAQ
jgi:DNA-binding SARP family transcriptional activator